MQLYRYSIVYKWILVIPFISFFACKSNQSSTEKGQITNKFSVEDLHRRTFHYFWDLAYPGNYQVPDRYPAESFSSIAATGFGLTAYLIGVEKKYITREECADRVLKTLRVLWQLPQGPSESGVSGHKGFFYHFLTVRDATRFKNVELSTIDTGLLMAGVLSVLTYFDGNSPVENEIRQLADALYRRVEWDWAMNGHKTMSMGWRPATGFLKDYWNGYNEAMILYVLALGSPSHTIPVDSWQQWCSTYEWTQYRGYEHVPFGPLFGHQYSQMYIDFRGIQDPFMKSKNMDYFENSRRATLSQIAYAKENPKKFKGYSEKLWGLTACDGPADKDINTENGMVRFKEYNARGVASNYDTDDGTIAPTAAGGSIPFAPKECLATLEYMWNTYPGVRGQYGFMDAFNLTYTYDGHKDGWYDKDYIGIDQGPILIQLENYQTEFVWKLMMKNEYIKAGLKKAGFTAK